MSFRIFSHSPKHWRNGTTFIGRTVCKLITEEKYDKIRVWKRTMYAEWWYLKQYYQNWLFLNRPNWANFIGILPTPDSSHGFSFKETPSRYSELREDTINSDGYAGVYTYIWVGAAIVYVAYTYGWARRWFNSFDFLAERNSERFAYIDGYSVSSDSYFLYWWNTWDRLVFPHAFHRLREEATVDFPHDSKVAPLCITLNRKNFFFEHYFQGTGEVKSMI